MIIFKIIMMKSNSSDWRALQALIGKLGAKSLKNRATKFDFDSLPKERAQKAHVRYMLKASTAINIPRN